MKAVAQLTTTDLAERCDLGEVEAGSKRAPDAGFAWRGWDPYITFSLFALSFLYLCLFRRFTSMDGDEGISLQGAQRVLAGQLPYRDFFSCLTPGSFYALALLFRIFGSSLVVARIALALAGAILSLITYLLARRVCSCTVALLMAGLATFTSLPYRFLILHNWDSTLVACLSIYCAVRLLEGPNLKWAFALGSFVSITVLFEQSKGAGLFLGLGAGFLAVFFLERSTFCRGAPSKLCLGGNLFRRRYGLALAFGLGWPLAITFGYFTAQHATSAMLADWLWPLQHYSQMNRVPYGYQNWTDAARHAIFASGSLPVRLILALTMSIGLWIPVLPILAVGHSAYWIFRTWRSHEINAKSRYYIVVTAGFVGMALSTALTRADIFHFICLQPLNCLMLAWLIEARDIPGRLVKSVQPVLAGYVVMALLSVGMIPLLNVLSAHERLETRRGIVTTREENRIVEYVQARVPPGETLLVYPYSVMYYYLTGTFSPSRYDYFAPGMNTSEQAEEIVRGLASGRVKVVLYDISFAEIVPHFWPGTPATALAHDPVGDYVMAQYRTCQILRSPDNWRFLFMIRNDLACP
jgi:hypothetical protein